MVTPGKIVHCLECVLHVNNISHCRITDSKLFVDDHITLPRWLGSSNCFQRSLLMSFLLGIVLTHT